MNLADMIYTGDFVQVITDKYVEDFGVKRGHLFYIAGVRPLPISEEDLYLQRIFVATHKVDKKGHTLINEGLFLMDPRDLQKVSKGRQEKFEKLLDEDWAMTEAIEASEEAVLN